jgi:ABC-type arginine transport system ATPase subunit
MTSLLRVEGLEAGYGKFYALFGADLEVGYKGIAVLLGPNGAGKSMPPILHRPSPLDKKPIKAPRPPGG